ncbi:MAG: hypothetical protein GY822_03235 [Deltaproteobacteria bacterium]|nr:hypothetical protein [Deltaproteobacteria bacterium]
MTTETESVLTAGDNCDSWCSKCKLILAHVIVAMVEDKPKKVQCNTCKANHVFRQYEPGKAPKKAAAKKATGVKKTTLKASDYEKMIEGRDFTNARRYSMKGNYIVSEIINHSKFGMGIVVLHKDTTKIEVLFPDGSKVLVHNRAA